MSTLPLLVKACHPEPTAAVTTLTALLAVDARLSLGTGILVTSAVFTGQLTIGWSNDLLDARRDRTVHRADKPLATGALAESTVRIALGLAVVACVVLSLLCGLRSGLTHLVLGVGSGWAYNLGIKRTVWSWVPYALAFGSLPAVVFLADDPPRLPPIWLMTAGALLGIGAHVVNVLPDIVDDTATGVRGLPHRLGKRKAQLVATCILVAASAVVVLGPGTAPPAWAWLALVVTVALACVGLRWMGKVAFRATIAIAAIDVVLIIAR